MGLRTKVGWIVRGHDNTMRTLDALSSDLRELQQRMDALVRAVEVDARLLREQQMVEFEGVRRAVIAATDDLSARIAALQRTTSDTR